VLAFNIGTTVSVVTVCQVQTKHENKQCTTFKTAMTCSATGGRSTHLRLSHGGCLGGQGVGEGDGVHDLSGLVARLLFLFLPGVIDYV
jgi:hypothetical protein